MLRRRRLESQFECRVYPAAPTRPRVGCASQCNRDAGGRSIAKSAAIDALEGNAISGGVLRSDGRLWSSRGGEDYPFTGAARPELEVERGCKPAVGTACSIESRW